MNAVTVPRPKAGPPDPDLDRLATDLRLVVGRMARRLRQQGDIGITASLLSAMWTIERLQPVTLGELSAAEQVQPPVLAPGASAVGGEAVDEGNGGGHGREPSAATPEAR